MQFRSVLFGMGTGIVLMALVFYLGLFLFDHNKAVRNEITELTDDEIIDRANKLGMIFIKELPQDTGDITESSESTELSDEELIQLATERGLLNDLNINEENNDLGLGDMEDALEIDESGALDQLIAIEIPPGSNSNAVAQLLHENNIINDLEDFNSYVTEKGYSTRIKAGTFMIPKDAAIDQILQIIIG